MTVEEILMPRTGLEKAVGKLNASDIAARLEALEHMDPVSAGILTRRVDPVTIGIGDYIALLIENVD